MNDVAQLSLDFDQALEQHALNVERIQRDAVFEIGRELAEAQELFKYSRIDGGFTGWLERRLPQFSERTAYRAIDVYKNVDPAMFAKLADIRNPSALAEVAKAPPDVQALIAERVEAGEIFTAAKVKEIREEAAAQAVVDRQHEIDQAREQIVALQTRIDERDEDSESLRQQLSELTERVTQFERDAKEFADTLPSAKQAEEIAADQDGVVLGKDMKFHAGLTPEQQQLSDDYLGVWSTIGDLIESPSPSRVVAGCPEQSRKQLTDLCRKASRYLAQIMEGLNAVS